MLSFYLSIIDNNEDKIKFEELYSKHKTTLFNIAYSILNDVQLSEDAVHEAFLSLAGNEKQFESFLNQSIKNCGDNYIEVSESWNIPHKFSHKFEKKMAKLIKSERKFYFRLIRTPV